MMGEILYRIERKVYDLEIYNPPVINIGRQLFSDIVCNYSTNKKRWHIIKF